MSDKVKVQGHRVLVRPKPLEEVVNGIVLVRANKDREQAMATEGTVLSVGPTCWQNLDFESPDWKPWCKEGDLVLFARNAGHVIPDPDAEEHEKDKVLFILNDEDILAVVERKE